MEQHKCSITEKRGWKRVNNYCTFCVWNITCWCMFVYMKLSSIFLVMFSSSPNAHLPAAVYTKVTANSNQTERKACYEHSCQ